MFLLKILNKRKKKSRIFFVRSSLKIFQDDSSEELSAKANFPKTDVTKSFKKWFFRRFFKKNSLEDFGATCFPWTGISLNRLFPEPAVHRTGCSPNTLMRCPFTEPMFGETPYKTMPVHLIHLFTERRLAPQNAVRARATAMANGVWRRQTPFGARADTHTHTHARRADGDGDS